MYALQIHCCHLGNSHFDVDGVLGAIAVNDGQVDGGNDLERHGLFISAGVFLYGLPILDSCFQSGMILNSLSESLDTSLPIWWKVFLEYGGCCLS